MSLTDLQKSRLVAKKIKPMFINTAEGRLWFEVVVRALADLVVNAYARADRSYEAARDRLSAIRFLSGDMVQAEVAGCDADYIRRVMQEVGLDLPDYNVERSKISNEKHHDNPRGLTACSVMGFVRKAEKPLAIRYINCDELGERRFEVFGADAFVQNKRYHDISAQDTHYLGMFDKNSDMAHLHRKLKAEMEEYTTPTRDMEKRKSKMREGKI